VGAQIIDASALEKFAFRWKTRDDATAEAVVSRIWPLAENSVGAANLDHFKLQTSASVPFAFNRAVLNKEAAENLDKLAGELHGKQFFIAVEGYTDSIENTLSKRRAHAVVNYLVSKHDVPIDRIQMIGMGKERSIDEGHAHAAGASNRPVEVKIFSSDAVLTTSISEKE
jgi:outer membrane protein OmpA-like peptidoglycan-associated protein